MKVKAQNTEFMGCRKGCAQIQIYNFKCLHLKEKKLGSRLAQSMEHVTPDFRVVSSSPTLGVEST